jgi:hypothetical protein
MKVNGYEFTVKELLEAVRIAGEGSGKDFREWYKKNFPFATSQTTELLQALDSAYDDIKSGKFQKELDMRLKNYATQTQSM